MEHKNYFFEKLTPLNNIDISVYEDAIAYVFDNADITNVAISGSYGAGKSSVIESYKEKHKDLKFMHISLAHFESPDESEEDVKESLLEGKILNQLIHQIPVEKIPQTNFRVKKGTRKRSIRLTTLLLCLLFGSAMFLMLSDKISALVEQLPKNIVKIILSGITGNYAVIFAGVIFVISSIISIYNLVKIQHNKNLFHKVSLQGNTIEIFEKQEESYFDKYLNEVLYLFEQVDVDAIVFEDMDRFNVNKIFERLREVNILTNIQRKAKFTRTESDDQYKPLRFFYLLRDDIFTTKDRTKFFDYIIPIVPILDGSNSYDQFIKQLKKGNIFDKFDPSFLQRLSLYIDDMRILKNVYNEFVVYIHRLNNTDLNWNKMLAIIVYKNLFPRDFSNFQLGKGYVHELFAQKDKFRNSAIEHLEEEKQQVLNNISRINDEILNDKQELNDAYKAKYEKLPQNCYGYTKEGQKRKDELDQEKSLREKAIEDREKGKIPDYEKEVADIDKKIVFVKTQLLSELITRDNADSVFMINSINPIGDEKSYNEIKGSDYFDLLKFLIRYGYIDETYSDYMTYFYEESLSANDKTFLRRITDKRGADFEYSLKEVQKVIASPVLRVVDFAEEETLNFDLLKGILNNQGITKYQEYLTTLIQQLKEKKQIDFISGYYNSDKFVDIFIVKLNEQWTEIFSYIVHNKAMSGEQIRNYSLDTLRLCEEQVVSQMNFDNSLSDYISQQDDYLNIQNVNIDNVISKFEILQVSFKSFNYEKSDKGLFDKVYENNLYDITFENIELMLRTQYGITSLYDIKHKNYTIIKRMPDSPLAQYVDANMQLYLEEVIENCEDRIEDDETKAITILNSDSIEDDIKEQYIGLLHTTITDITKISGQELWRILIARRIVAMSASNAVYYFQAHGLDDELVRFINGMDISTDFTGVEDEFDEDITEKFFDAIVINNMLETDKYQKILTDIGYYFDKYDAEEIDDEKMHILIENRIIQMNEAGLNYVRNNYESQLMYFIERNIDKYVEIQNDDIFLFEEAVKVLDFDFDDAKKIELLGFTDKSVSVLHRKYSTVLFVHILEHNFDANDAECLFKDYSKYNELECEAIYKVAVSRITDIISKSTALDDNLLSDVLTKSNLRKNIKIQVWAISIPNLNEETCKKHFDELGVPELKGIFTKKNTTNRTYPKTNDVKEIFDALKRNTWIYDYYVSEGPDERYIVIKNAPQNRKSNYWKSKKE